MSKRTRKTWNPFRQPLLETGLKWKGVEYEGGKEQVSQRRREQSRTMTEERKGKQRKRLECQRQAKW